LGADDIELLARNYVGVTEEFQLLCKRFSIHITQIPALFHTVLIVRNDLLVIAVLKLSDILLGKGGSSGAVDIMSGISTKRGEGAY
jgi:hypothetical protein